jgi:hypothetical protein
LCTGMPRKVVCDRPLDAVATISLIQLGIFRRVVDSIRRIGPNQAKALVTLVPQARDRELVCRVATDDSMRTDLPQLARLGRPFLHELYDAVR